MSDPIVVDDGRDSWVVYPGENNYELLAALPEDDKGVRHAAPELVDQLQGWNWREAAARADKIVEGLTVPWGELLCTTEDVADGNLMNLSGKLAKISYYIVQCNNILTRLLSMRSLAKESLEQAVNKALAMEAAFGTSGKSPAQALRAASLVSRNRQLRSLKIELMEAGAQIEALSTVKESLDVLWRTASRVISARASEPIDRGA